MLSEHVRASLLHHVQASVSCMTVATRYEGIIEEAFSYLG